MWTGLDSARALFSDRHCWREHVALDPRTGMDPEGVRLRAAEGFEAADYFMGEYECGTQLDVCRIVTVHLLGLLLTL